MSSSSDGAPSLPMHAAHEVPHPKGLSESLCSWPLHRHAPTAGGSGGLAPARWISEKHHRDSPAPVTRSNQLATFGRQSRHSYPGRSHPFGAWQGRQGRHWGR